MIQNYSHIMNLFWQYPVITEKTFYAQNSSNPNYVGLPWATIIDSKIQFSKIIATVIDNVNTTNDNFTCCQHIKFRDLIPMFKILNVKLLFTPHKIKTEDSIDGITIKSCPLYAVNVEDDERNGVFKNIDFLSHPRKYLYSFQGAHMSHYLTRIRQNIFELPSRDKGDVYIKNIGNWHFDEIVYTDNQNDKQTVRLSTRHTTNTKEYNELFIDTTFSLCPSGAGPSSIRFWEALAVGSIPVLLSDTMELPEHDLWSSSIIIVSESDIHTIDKILRSITHIEIETKRKNCIQLYNYFKNNYINNKDSIQTKTSQITKNPAQREIIHYCCGSYDTNDYGGVARYDSHLKMIFSERKFFKGPQEKDRLLNYLKKCANPLIITDNHLACDIPNDYDLILVHHGCARRTDEVSTNWDPYWRDMCVNGQDKMFKHRSPKNTHIISISEDVFNIFTLYYGDEYKLFKNTKILHTSELNENYYHDYKSHLNTKKLNILGNWGGYIKGNISILSDELKHKYSFNQLRINPQSFKNIQMCNDVKQSMYIKSDIFLQLSGSEGNSYATLDAVLCGMVIVTTPVGLFGGDVPEDCFVKIEQDQKYNAEYIDNKIQFAWNNRLELSEKMREWYMNNCAFSTWKSKMYELLSKKDLF
jgi:hypothetical protein